MNFVEAEHPAVVAFAEEATAGASSERDKAVALYYAVRDGIRYDPYSMSEDPDAYRSSTVLKDRTAYCIPKAVLLCGAARAAGIPARLGFADVRNHLTSPKLEERLGGTGLFIWHGYTELLLDARWVKVTPAFNIELCERFAVHPLDFDGEHDALFHPFTTDGRAHMEYIRYRGTFEELPLEQIMAEFRQTYPLVFKEAAPADAAFNPA